MQLLQAVNPEFPTTPQRQVHADSTAEYYRSDKLSGAMTTTVELTDSRQPNERHDQDHPRPAETIFEAP